MENTKKENDIIEIKKDTERLSVQIPTWIRELVGVRAGQEMCSISQYIRYILTDDFLDHNLVPQDRKDKGVRGIRYGLTTNINNQNKQNSQKNSHVHTCKNN